MRTSSNITNIREKRIQANMAFEKEPLISIIIPVYNVEQYLRQCIDSVLNQSFFDYELILVDDGSPDNCPVICDEYCIYDKRVKTIHKENGGLSDARNFGIRAAKGKYLLFVDSDDFIAENSLLLITEALKSLKIKNEPDIVFLNAVRYYSEKKICSYGEGYLNKEDIMCRNRLELIKYLAEIPQFHLSACLKLVKRELIISNDIFFTKGLNHEDVDWSIKLYLHAEVFGYTEHIHYYYRQSREGSIISAFSEKRFSDVLFIIKKWYDSTTFEYREYKNIIYKFLYHQYYFIVPMYKELDSNARKKYKSIMNEFSWLLDLTKSKKAYIVKLFYKLFGLRFLSVTLNCFNNLGGNDDK